MRKLNVIIIAGIAVVFTVHAALGAFALAGLGYLPQKQIARACLFLVGCHVVLTAVLMVKTFRAMRKAGTGYLAGNGMFWVRRISGAAIIPLIVIHLTVFITDGEPPEFGIGRMITQILLVAAITIHVLANIRPAAASLGVRSGKLAVAAAVAVSAALLLFASAFLIYYIRL